MPNFISEDDIDRGMVQRLQHLYGYDVLDCLTSDPADVQDVSGCGTPSLPSTRPPSTLSLGR